MSQFAQWVYTALKTAVQVWCVLALGYAYVELFRAVWWFKELGQSRIDNILFPHFAAVVGLPVAALGALVLVMFLKHPRGEITVKLGGTEYSGAQGELILWTVAYTTMVLSIKLLW
jgi:hypothetical protein